ncbi:hypothetical protein QBC44DRAFT_400099 [Cladorrhinum sp. PSN332]|nr:hypothetical protein QBC44DRAFT_400099 [Cladorrhinum sp. PSN332]
MSDPLSIAASIAGLISVALTVGKALGPYVSAARDTPKIAIQVHAETQAATIILSALQNLTNNLDAVSRSRAALIQVDYLITVLTNGVLIFSELEACVGDLPVPDLSITGLGLRSRLGWARKETALDGLLSRLEGFKSSISTILNILQANSAIHAEQSQHELTAHVISVLESNEDILRRVMNLEDFFDARSIIAKKRPTTLSSAHNSLQRTQTIDATTPSPSIHLSPVDSVFTTKSTAQSSISTDISTPGDAVVETIKSSESTEMVCTQASLRTFESDLELSRVYRRALNDRNSMDFSMHSSGARTHGWSIFSGLSLSEISALSVIALPIFAADISNSHHYAFRAKFSAPRPQQECMCMAGELNLAGELFARSYPTSLWGECLEIEHLLSQIDGFPELFTEARRHDAHMHPFLVLRYALRQGYPLLLLLNVVEDHGWTLATLTRSIGLSTHGIDAPEVTLRKGIDTLSKMLPGVAMFSVGDVVGHEHDTFLAVIPVVKDILARLADWRRIRPSSSHLEPVQERQELQNNQALPSIQGIVEAFIADERSYINNLTQLATTFEKSLSLAKCSDVKSEAMANLTLPLAVIRQIIRLQLSLLLDVDHNLFASSLDQRWRTPFKKWSSEAVVLYDMAMKSGIGDGDSLGVAVKLHLHVRTLHKALSAVRQRPRVYKVFITCLQRHLIDTMPFSYALSFHGDIRDTGSIIQDTLDCIQFSTLSEDQKWLSFLSDFRRLDDFGPLVLFDIVSHINGIVASPQIDRYYVSLHARALVLSTSRITLGFLPRGIRSIRDRRIIRLLNMWDIKQDNASNTLTLSQKPTPAGEQERPPTIITFPSRDLMLAWATELQRRCNRVRTNSPGVPRAPGTREIGRPVGIE